MTADLARRAIDGFAETLACLGRTGVGGAREVRAGGLVGARVPWAADNHWIDAAVGASAPGVDDPPHCWWSVDVPAGRRELADVPMPCMGLDLATFAGAGAEAPATPPLDVVGAVNDRAYAQADRLAPLIAALDDVRVRAHGLRVGGDWGCVAVTVRLGDDVSIQYVATPEAFRRRGLAGRLLTGILAQARVDGLRTATLQASPDGFGVYARLGFRTVTTLRASIA